MSICSVETYKQLFKLSIICQHCRGGGNWNNFLPKTRTWVFLQTDVTFSVIDIELKTNLRFKHYLVYTHFVLCISLCRRSMGGGGVGVGGGWWGWGGWWVVGLGWVVGGGGGGGLRVWVCVRGRGHIILKCLDTTWTEHYYVKFHALFIHLVLKLQLFPYLKAISYFSVNFIACWYFHW